MSFKPLYWSISYKYSYKELKEPEVISEDCIRMGCVLDKKTKKPLMMVDMVHNLIEKAHETFATDFSHYLTKDGDDTKCWVCCVDHRIYAEEFRQTQIAKTSLMHELGHIINRDYEKIGNDEKTRLEYLKSGEVDPKELRADEFAFEQCGLVKMREFFANLLEKRKKKYGDELGILELKMRKEHIEEYAKQFVWYVCYGSNLALDRFMCYLTGEGSPKYNITQNDERTCVDTMPPKNSKKIDIPYELYFAYHSSTWEGCSVAFLDVSRRGHTYGRAYLITEEQYKHVYMWENNSQKRQPKPADLYGYQVDLGLIDGISAKTFTSFVRRIDVHRVSPLYVDVMKNGLKELGLSKDTINNYMTERLPN